MAGGRCIFVMLCAAMVVGRVLGQEQAKAIPDLSGVWGRNTIDYLPPESGVGPIKNISGSRNMMVGDYQDPLLKPWAAEIVKRNGEISRTGYAFPTAHNQCWPEPPPYTLSNQQLQVLQQKNRVTLMYSHGHQVRYVRLNGKHPANPTPSWYGDSIGHYEDDTLVVDTIGIKVAPLSSVDRYGTPHTEALHVVERYHMVDQASAAAEPLRRGGFQGDVDDAVDRNYTGPLLRVDFTVEDAGTFSMPWSGAVVYRRAAGRRLIEDVCAENLHDFITGKDADVPTARTARISGD
jgi:hypothetical protein